jgi:hypothetical protein
VERDLLQAKITIDMLDMIKEKTSGNLEEDEKRILDTVLMELRMNYVDETKRKEPVDGKEEDSEEVEGKTEEQIDGKSEGEFETDSKTKEV